MSTVFATPVNAAVFPATTVATGYTPGAGSLQVAGVGTLAVASGFVVLSIFRAGTLLTHLKATGLTGTTFSGVVVMAGHTDVALNVGDNVYLNLTPETANHANSSAKVDPGLLNCRTFP